MAKVKIYNVTATFAIPAGTEIPNPVYCGVPNAVYARCPCGLGGRFLVLQTGRVICTHGKDVKSVKEDCVAFADTLGVPLTEADVTITNICCKTDFGAGQEFDRHNPRLQTKTEEFRATVFSSGHCFFTVTDEADIADAAAKLEIFFSEKFSGNKTAEKIK